MPPKQLYGRPCTGQAPAAHYRAATPRVFSHHAAQHGRQNPHRTVLNNHQHRSISNYSKGFGTAHPRSPGSSGRVSAAAAGDPTAGSSSCQDIFPVEFGSEALLLIRKAATVAARRPAAVGHGASTGINPNSEAAAVAAAAPEVSVTEQHLMLALLQLHPEAVQVLGRHTLADDNKATDFSSTAADEIAHMLAIALDSRGGGYKLDMGITADAQPGIRLSGQLAQIMNEALIVTRQLGLPSVQWPSLLWAYMRFPTAHEAAQGVLGKQLISADIAEELHSSLKNQSSCHAQTKSGAAITPSSDSAQGQAIFWMEHTLDLALLEALKALQAGAASSAVSKIAATIKAVAGDPLGKAPAVVAAARYQPSEAWLDAAWRCITLAALPANNTQLLDMAADIIAAAYYSVIEFRYHSPGIGVIFSRAASSASATFDITTSLEALVVADTCGLAAVVRDHVVNQLAQVITPETFRAERAPPPTVLVHAMPKLLSPSFQGSAGWLAGLSSKNRSYVMSEIYGKTCEWLLPQTSVIPMHELFALVEFLSASLANIDRLYRDSLLQALESSLHSIVKDSRGISTQDYIKLYMVTAGLAAGQCSGPRHSIIRGMLERVQRKDPRTRPAWLQCASGPIIDEWSTWVAKSSQWEAKYSYEREEKDAAEQQVMQQLSVPALLVLANDAGIGQSSEQVDALLRAIARQHVPPAGSWQNMLIKDMVLRLAEPILSQSLTAVAAPQVAQLDRKTELPATTIASLLHSLQQLQVYLSAETFRDLLAALPELLAQTQSETLGHVVAFIAHQQVQHCGGGPGLTLSKACTTD